METLHAHNARVELSAELLGQFGNRTAGRPYQRPDGCAGNDGFFLILVCIFFYKAGMRFPGLEAIPPVLGSVLIISSGGGIANRFLSIRPLVAVGLISYSLFYGTGRY